MNLVSAYISTPVSGCSKDGPESRIRWSSSGLPTRHFLRSGESKKSVRALRLVELCCVLFSVTTVCTNFLRSSPTSPRLLVMNAVRVSAVLLYVSLNCVRNAGSFWNNRCIAAWVLAHCLHRTELPTLLILPPSTWQTDWMGPSYLSPY